MADLNETCLYKLADDEVPAYLKASRVTTIRPGETGSVKCGKCNGSCGVVLFLNGKAGFVTSMDPPPGCQDGSR